MPWAASRPRRWIGAAALALLLLASSPGQVAGQEALDWVAIGDEGVRLLQEYVRLATVNPPGDEELATDFLAPRFVAEGIPYEVVEGAPGRANIVARLRGDGKPGRSRRAAQPHRRGACRCPLLERRSVRG